MKIKYYQWVYLYEEWFIAAIDDKGSYWLPGFEKARPESAFVKLGEVIPIPCAR